VGCPWLIAPLAGANRIHSTKSLTAFDSRVSSLPPSVAIA
jgi:hypothetical protein